MLPVGKRFQQGNTAAVGHANPHAGQVQRLRADLYSVVTPSRLRALGRKLYYLAMDGDMQAAKLLLAYVLGPPEVTVRLSTGEEQSSFRALVEESFRRDANGHDNGHSGEDVAIIDVDPDPDKNGGSVC